MVTAQSAESTSGAEDSHIQVSFDSNHSKEQTAVTKQAVDINMSWARRQESNTSPVPSAGTSSTVSSHSSPSPKSSPTPSSFGVLNPISELAQQSSSQVMTSDPQQAASAPNPASFSLVPSPLLSSSPVPLVKQEANLIPRPQAASPSIGALSDVTMSSVSNTTIATTQNQQAAPQGQPHQWNNNNSQSQTSGQTPNPMAQIASTGGIRHNLNLKRAIVSPGAGPIQTQQQQQPSSVPVPVPIAVTAPPTATPVDPLGHNFNTATSHITIASAIGSNLNFSTPATTAVAAATNTTVAPTPKIVLQSVHQSMPDLSCSEPVSKSPRLESLQSLNNASTTATANRRRLSSFSSGDKVVPLHTPSSCSTTTTTVNPVLPLSSSSTTASTVITSSTTTSAPSTLNERRQRRLERNRESARLSRRRRKQYLEVLEERVKFLSEETDRGRKDHVLQSVQTYRSMRRDVLNSIVMSLNTQAAATTAAAGVNPTFESQVNVLRSNLLRTSKELMVGLTFSREYLKSLVTPPASKFVLWLTLQNDVYFRGGRAASERLSAARIGERMLNNGNDHVPPSNGMWPLLCNEIGLSYDQEERMRSLQRKLLAAPESWLNRHSSCASEHVIYSLHKAITTVNDATTERESKVMSILTPEQKAKYYVWLSKKKKQDIDKLASVLSSKLNLQQQQQTNINNNNNNAMNVEEVKEEDIEPLPGRHLAANMYVINHKLQQKIKLFPNNPPLVSAGDKLKKLSRRPSFESLAAVNEEEKASSGKSRKMSKSGSSGSLKRSSSEMSCESMGTGMNRSGSNHSLANGNVNGITSLTPEAAQAAASHVVAAELGPVRACIPSARKTTNSPEQMTVLNQPQQTGGTTTTTAAAGTTGTGGIKLRTVPMLQTQQRLPTIQQNQQSLHQHQTPFMVTQQTYYQPQQQTTATATITTAPTTTPAPAATNQQQAPHPGYVPFQQVQYTQQKQQQPNTAQTVLVTHAPVPIPAPAPNAPIVASTNLQIQGIATQPQQQQLMPQIQQQQQQQQNYQNVYNQTSLNNTNTLNPVQPYMNVQQQPMAQTSNPPTTNTTITVGNSNHMSVPSPLLHATSVPTLNQASTSNNSFLPNDTSNVQQQQQQQQQQQPLMKQDKIYDNSVISIESPADSANIVSEDGSLYNVLNQVADDSLFDFAAEDWAIGEGFEMDLE